MREGHVIFGISFGVLAFWLLAQTTLNISPLPTEEERHEGLRNEHGTRPNHQ